MGGISLEEVIEAYYDCRHNKRNTMNQLKFELDYERELIDLWQELNEHRYKPRRSIAFIVDHPVKREIFAADFRDRVVHHLIYRRVMPLLEKQFLTDSYATQVGKGTLFGIQRVEQHIRDCSENYTCDCWIMKLDISGYFMSINKQLLYECIRDFLEPRYQKEQLPMLLYLLRKTIFNRPERHCARKVPKARWVGLPRNKSLFSTDGSNGLPIGNLTSQMLALLYLDGLDHKITEEWGVPHYGRYVDDMVLVHPSAEYLLEVREKINNWLKERGLRLHPKKMYLQHYTKGVMFVGGMIKPGRKYISKRTVGRLFARIHWYNEWLAETEDKRRDEIESMVACMNSYLGMMRHYQSNRIFHRMMRRITPLWYRYTYISKRGPQVKLVPVHKKRSALPLCSAKNRPFCVPNNIVVTARLVYYGL